MRKNKKKVFSSLVIILLFFSSFIILELISLRDLSFEVNDLEFSKNEKESIEITVKLEVHNSHWKKVTVKKIIGKVEMNDLFLGDVYSSSFSVAGKETKQVSLALTILPLQTDLSPMLSMLLESFLTNSKLNIKFSGKAYYRSIPFSFEETLSEPLSSTDSVIDILYLKAPLNSSELEFGILIDDFPIPINITSCFFAFTSVEEMGNLTLTEPLILLEREQSLLNLTFETSKHYSRENFLTLLLSNYPEQNITLSGGLNWTYYDAFGSVKLPEVDFSIDKLVEEEVVVLNDFEVISIDQQEESDEIELRLNVTLYNTYLMDINISNILFNAYLDENLTTNIANAQLLANYYLESNTTNSLIITLTVLLNDTTNRLIEIITSGFKLELYNKYEYTFLVDSLEVPITTVETWEISLF